MTTYESRKSELAFAFDLHLVCGGYAYFSAYSAWERVGSHGRDVRAPRPIKVLGMFETLRSLEQEVAVILCEADIDDWMQRQGWAVVSMDFCRSNMPHWLQAKECIRDSMSTFTSIDVASPGALSHRAGAGKRDKVINRDRCRCLLCGKSEADGVKLTMQHILPYGHGGATTTRNLASLCDECNQRAGSQFIPQLFGLAGLPHFADLGLLRGDVTEEKIGLAVAISANLMHTRCDIW